MKRVLISTILLSTLLFNGHEAKAQTQIRKNIDNFNQLTEDRFGNTTTCPSPDPMIMTPIPCIIDLLVDISTSQAESYEVGLSPENVIGAPPNNYSRGMTLTLNQPILDAGYAFITLTNQDEVTGNASDLGTFQFNNAEGVFSTANVIWDGEGMGLPDFDMSSYENQLAYYDNFVLGVYTVDVSTEFTFEVTNMNGEVARLTKIPGVDILNDGVVDELFFSLSDPGWTNRSVFITPIRSIALIVNSQSTTDLIIDYFELQKIIPEPSLVWGTVVVLGTGIISTYKRRKPL